MLQTGDRPQAASALRSGGQLIVDCLLAHGVDTVFCLPGESFLAVLDALGDVRDRINVVVGRHEASVAQMAEAYGKLTGRPGICFVTRGPGATHASIALHTAWHDSTPLILFVGQVGRDQLGREAFQEMDYPRLFGGTAKWVAELVDATRAPEIIGRAFHTAVNGRPGPVVVSLPEDMQNDGCTVADPGHYRLASCAPSEASLQQVAAFLDDAERPLMIVGGGGWSPEAVADLRKFAERFEIPVAAGFRRQDLFDNTHPNYAGVLGLGTNPKLVEMVGRADLILAVGERLGDMTTDGYKLLASPRPVQRLVHVLSGAEQLGLLYEADLLINSSARDFAAAVARLAPRQAPERGGWVEDGHAAYLDYVRPPARNGSGVDIAKVVSDLSARLPGDAVICNGAGLYTSFVHRYYQFRDYGSQLASTTGPMGYGLPAAIAAKAVNPDRIAICFAGDGCFMMASQEFATAMRHGLPVIAIVIDNSSFGSIRSHQERYFPGRVMATDLRSPDFVALAKAYGAHAERVERTEDFLPAFERALASGLPSLLTVRQDIEEAVGIRPRKAEVAA